MRKKYLMMNMVIGLGAQMLIVLIGFVSRRVFVDTLGLAMQGVNSALTSIITMISLTELGIGTAIICNLYKPLAEDDKPRIIGLMQLYKKVYNVIGMLVIVIGLCLAPFVRHFLSTDDFLALPTICGSQGIFLIVLYLLFLSDTAVSYFYAYKRSIIIADQKNFVVTLVTTCSSLTYNAGQIVILILTKNFILYMAFKVLCRIMENLIIAAIANRKYPYIREKKKYPVEKSVTAGIVSNTKSLALHYIGMYLINGTDMMIITKLLGAVISGAYSNYYLITNTLKALFDQMAGGITASFGNFLAKDETNALYGAFQKVLFVDFALSNFAAVSLFCLLNPFIHLWLGDSISPETYAVFSPVVLLVICLIFYNTAVSEIIGALRAGAGLFRPDRYLHLALAALNLVISVGFVKIAQYFNATHGTHFSEIIGVFLGTLICQFIKELSVLPWIVYKNVFKRKLWDYQKLILKYAAVTFLAGGISYAICYFICPVGQDTILTFVAKCLVCVVVPNLLVVALFFRTEEFKYLLETLRGIVYKLLRRTKEETA